MLNNLSQSVALRTNCGRKWCRPVFRRTARHGLGRSEPYRSAGVPKRLSLQASQNPPKSDGDESRWPKDEYGPYPWDPLWQSTDNNAPQWVQGELVTLFTADGLVQIRGGPRLVNPLSPSAKKFLRLNRQRRFREEDYMDPKQGLCIGAIFDIAATNGLDMGRRFCVFGFCRSIEMLNDVVQDAVLGQGGEVVVSQRETKGGVHEKLTMTVAMPLLWGIPPAVDTLNYAIRSGGGIVEKVYRKWEFF